MAKKKDKTELLKQELDKIPEEKQKESSKKDKLAEAVKTLRDEFGAEFEPVKNVSFKIKKVTEYLNERYDFRYNIINGETEYKRKGEANYQYWENRIYRDVRTELLQNNISISKEQFENLVYGSFLSENYNPFMNYFNRIGKCESEFEYEGPASEKKFKKLKTGKDYIKEYCDQVYIPDENERAYFVEGFRKWFVALVVSLIKDIPHKYFINQVCLVLFGGQGKLKSTWLENIVPEEMRMKYIYSSHFDPRQRDHMQFLATHIMIILEEMAALNKTDIETMKGVMTETKFAGRLSYDKEKTYLKRRASFTATQNNKEFMKDESGSRRFFVVEIESINIQRDFEIDKMYSQGLQHFKDGLKYWFDNEDIRKQEARNEQFQQRTFEYELVQKYFSVPDPGDLLSDSQFVKYVSSTDIAVSLSKDNNINVNNTVKANIGKALNVLGFKQYSRRLAGKPVKLWFVKEALSLISKPIDDISNVGNADDIIEK